MPDYWILMPERIMIYEDKVNADNIVTDIVNLDSIVTDRVNSDSIVTASWTFRARNADLLEFTSMIFFVQTLIHRFL
jgi:hypothetical protein